jgi:hypothetical protein
MWTGEPRRPRCCAVAGSSAIDAVDSGQKRHYARHCGRDGEDHQGSVGASAASAVEIVVHWTTALSAALNAAAEPVFPFFARSLQVRRCLDSMTRDKRCAARSASWSRRDLNFFDVAGTIAGI